MSNVQKRNANVDERDQSNAFKFATSQSIDDAKHDAMINALMHDDTKQTSSSTSTITLKQIINDRKIKCDAKLIRRVLRKYYASKINHQHRDAWVFQTSQIDDVVKLIDTHCRANTSSTK
jgi:hypothetical protein